MKRQVKKLALCAETLRILDASHLANIAGGVSYMPACDTNAVNCNSQAQYCTATNLCSGCGPCL